MRVIKKLLKLIGILFLVIVLMMMSAVVLLCYAFYKASAVPEDYTGEIPTGGAIEATYLANGACDVSHQEVKTEDKAIKKYEIWYPSELVTENKKYPVVVVVNGTGVFATKAAPLFEHLASWGFIVIGNQDPSTWSGQSTDRTLSWLLAENESSDSLFYGKVDLEHIGITGHSQGGVGVFNAITKNEHREMYQCAVSLSPPEKKIAEMLRIPYDSSQTRIPLLLLAGTENDVITQKGMREIYDELSVNRVMARRAGTGHGEMLYSADGYVTAWFMWLLKNDSQAKKAFIGDRPELSENVLYQDKRIDISE